MKRKKEKRIYDWNYEIKKRIIIINIRELKSKE